MVELYGGCFGAFITNNRGELEHRVLAVTASTSEGLDSVKEGLMRKAKETLPTSDGWFNHYAEAIQVSDSQMRDYLMFRD